MTNNDEVDNNVNKKKEKIYEILRDSYEDEREKTKGLDDQARSLVGSILVVIGFLLATGMISQVHLDQRSSIFYFIGILILVASVFIAFLAFRFKAAKIPMPYKEKDYLMSLHELMKKSDEEVSNVLRIRTFNAIKHNWEKNVHKKHLISVAWALMIFGLVMVTTFAMAFILESYDSDNPSGRSVTCNLTVPLSDNSNMTGTVKCSIVNSSQLEM